MFFIIPKEVDVPQARIPFVNWLIIALIILVFAFQVKTLLDYKVQREKEQQDRSISTQTQEQKQAEKPSLVDKFEPFFLDGWELKGIFGHMWLHAGFFHIAGNLLFLWVFGNAVCSKVGNFTYLLFYLCVGVFAAAAHLVFSGGTAIGASGAINGIVGMFLIFFPENEITCYYFFYWIVFLRAGSFDVSSVWMVLLWLGFDILGVLLSGTGVAYFAHLGGFFAGAVLGTIMLKMGWIKMETWERSLFDMIKGRKSGEEEFEVRQFGGKFDREMAMVGGSSPDTQSAPEPSAPKEKTTTESTAAKRNAAAAAPQPVKAKSPPRQHTPSGTGAAGKRFEPKKLPDKGDGFTRFYCMCGKRIKVPAKHSGRKGRCPKCNQKLLVP